MCAIKPVVPETQEEDLEDQDPPTFTEKYSEKASTVLVQDDPEFAEQRAKLMELLEACDDTIDYKEMDDQLESLRRKKEKGRRATRESRKEHVDNTKVHAEYKAQMYYNMIKK